MTTTRGAGLDPPTWRREPSVADPPDGVPEGVREDHDAGVHETGPGPFARLGRWAATHFRHVLIAWLLVLLGFGFFAIHVENALAGAGWQASNSQSVAARAIIEKDFSGLGATGLQVVIVDHHGADRVGPTGPDRRGQGDQRAPQRSPGLHRRPASSRGLAVARRPDGDHHRRIGRRLEQDGAGGRRRREPRWQLSTSSGVTVTLTGDSALWADFNTANRSAMLRSEMLSWPVTIIILIIAFGSLVAAGLPLLLTMAGLLVAAGALVITTKFMPVSIWALNFALMFALALGIDYALFLVMRFRTALERREAPNRATARRSLPRWPRRSTPPARPWRSAR